MIESLLVANRGEIARRVIRTARRLGVRTVAVYSQADAGAAHALEADVAVEIGPAAPAESYRDIGRVLAAARGTGAQAVHPGYGFLSENPAFATAVTEAGLVWVGPPAAAIAAMGDKVAARNLVSGAGVPVAPGTRTPVTDLDAAVVAAADVGYPLMVKASAGGGGMGMAVAEDEAALRSAFPRIEQFAERTFGHGGVLLERYFPHVRHVEVQILGLADGRVVALGERDCSVQRRNQKICEEAPSPAVDPALRARMLAAAVLAGSAVGYRNAGTVECLVPVDEAGRPVEGDDPGFVFLEMNTRLQVEHPITEAVFGIDLVEQQLRIASGEPVTFDPDALVPQGHALELRVNAEDPVRFLPGPGTVTTWVEPVGDGIRVDAGYRIGDTVTPYYDSLLAKLVVHAADRPAALALARQAVADFRVEGPKCNLPFFSELLADPAFVSGGYDTGIVTRIRRPGPR